VIGFVNEAMRTIESASSSPAAAISTSSPRATSAEAPGAAPVATASCTNCCSPVVTRTVRA
jgi:hypothetical protein